MFVRVLTVRVLIFVFLGWATSVALAAPDALVDTWRTLVVSNDAANQLAAVNHSVNTSAHEQGATHAPAAWLNKWVGQPASVPWTNEALSLIVKYQQNPLRAARALSYLHAAMYDALIIASRAGLDERLQRVAIHSAASATLEYFYPQETDGRLGAMGHAAAYAEHTQRKDPMKSAAHAWTIGQQTAVAARERAGNDGAASRWDIRTRPAAKPGLWQAAPPLNVYAPAEPRAGEWRTWLLKNGAEMPAAPPLPYGSNAYWREVREVLDVYRKLTREQKKIADDWHLGQGTVTPAGVWNLRAQEIVRQKKLGTAESARLFAALNAAMMDAFIACWHVKFIHWTERPVTAIQAKFQADFLPYLVTPPFPSYVSGHATVSGAASEVLAAFFPDEAKSFRNMAEEAAMSRLYGGIHFRSDNQQGLALGRDIGRTVMERLSSESVVPAIR